MSAAPPYPRRPDDPDPNSRAWDLLIDMAEARRDEPPDEGEIRWAEDRWERSFWGD